MTTSNPQKDDPTTVEGRVDQLESDLARLRKEHDRLAAMIAQALATQMQAQLQAQLQTPEAQRALLDQLLGKAEGATGSP